MSQFRAHVENGFCNSDQKNMLMVGFLTCNDSDILRAKTGPYRRVGYQTNIPPTPSELKVAETYIKAIKIIKLDKCMRMLEELMDRWPFLINDVLLCRNPNDVQEWEKWVALWADNDDKVWFASLVQSLLLNCLN